MIAQQDTFGSVVEVHCGIFNRSSRADAGDILPFEAVGEGDHSIGACEVAQQAADDPAIVLLIGIIDEIVVIVRVVLTVAEHKVDMWEISGIVMTLREIDFQISRIFYVLEL